MKTMLYIVDATKEICRVGVSCVAFEMQSYQRRYEKSLVQTRRQFLLDFDQSFLIRIYNCQ